jgi:hypothetical protein
VFLMAIKIFRPYMSILSVYKPGINSTVNELFVFEKRIEYVNKATYSMHASEIILSMSVFVIICFE